MASEIRVNQIQNRSGLTTTTFTDTGVIISGILTVSDDLNVGGVLTYEDVTNVDAVGTVPEAILEAFKLVKLAPEPEKVVAVATPTISTPVSEKVVVVNPLRFCI